jgi:hypothetical protein
MLMYMEMLVNSLQNINFRRNLFFLMIYFFLFFLFSFVLIVFLFVNIDDLRKSFIINVSFLIFLLLLISIQMLILCKTKSITYL